MGGEAKSQPNFLKLLKSLAQRWRIIITCGAVRLGCRVSTFVYCGVLDPGFAASLLVPRSRLVADRGDWGLLWHVAVDSFRHVVVQQDLLASLETEEKTRRRGGGEERWRGTCGLCTRWHASCVLLVIVLRLVRAALDRITVKDSDSVLRRRCGGLGLTCCEHAATSSNSPGELCRKPWGPASAVLGLIVVPVVVQRLGLWSRQCRTVWRWGPVLGQGC